jgi:hypothetical protein
LLDVKGDRVERLGLEEFGAIQAETITEDGSEDSLTRAITSSTGNVDFSNFFQNGPVTISARVKNAGNVQIKPIGTVTLKKSFGGEDQSFEFNEARANILPDSVRRFDIPQEDLGYGRYTATLSLSYGDGGDIINSETTFWVLPYGYIAGLVVGVGVVTVLAGVGLKRYRNHILKQAKR